MPYQCSYSETRPPRTPLEWLRCRWRRWRARHEQDVADGRDYTGWGARVISLPPAGAPTQVGTEGLVVECREEHGGLVHDVELPGATWVTVLPSRHIELIPPT